MKVTRPTSNPWDSILTIDRPKRTGLSPEQIQRKDKWSQAIFFGGSTLALWNKAVELKLALLCACALKKGQTIMVIGKYAEESGLIKALQSNVGPEGKVVTQEIGSQALESFSKQDGVSENKLQWDFHYLDTLLDKSLDRVILFGSAGHVSNWQNFIQQIDRVLTVEGRVIIADAPWGGKELIAATRLDIHATSMLDTLLAGIGIKIEDLPQIGPEELQQLFQPYLRLSRNITWRGLYLCYGEKSGKEAYYEFPVMTKEINTFLKEETASGPWHFLSSAEVKAFGKEVTEVEMQKKWGQMLLVGGSLEWINEISSGIISLMYDNLKVKEGDKVLLIGERIDTLGFLPEIQKRIGDKGEVVFFDLNKTHFNIIGKVLRGDPDAPPISERHQWVYDYADNYPDNYFDLIWLPQAVHHARSWEEAAPRLVRALKPDGQIMLLESRVMHPVFHNAMQMSALLQSIYEKTVWAMDCTFSEFPDYTTEQLAQAFGSMLEDVFYLEWKGWLIFWGYKRKK